MTMKLLSGKVALITGAASGIGRAAADVFAAHGAQVVLADVNAAGEAAAQEVRAAGGEAMFVRTDVSRAQEVEALVAAAVARYGRLDCAFNNAGIDGLFGSTADCTEENWDRVVAVNLKGVFLCMKFEIAQMLKQGGGAIVNTASVAGLVGVARLPAYVASKHGVVGLSRAAAIEYAKRGIRVNALCPGAVRTPMIEDVIRQGFPEAELDAMQPIGRIGAPAELAEAAAWMCSDKAAFMTGHPMVVDGGLTAQ